MFGWFPQIFLQQKMTCCMLRLTPKYTNAFHLMLLQCVCVCAMWCSSVLYGNKTWHFTKTNCRALWHSNSVHDKTELMLQNFEMTLRFMKMSWLIQILCLHLVACWYSCVYVCLTSSRISIVKHKCGDPWCFYCTVLSTYFLLKYFYILYYASFVPHSL